jgi:hypothetical protein
LFDHLQSNPRYVAALALHFEELHHRSRRSEDIASSCADNPKTDLRLIALIVWVCRNIHWAGDIWPVSKTLPALEKYWHISGSGAGLTILNYGHKFLRPQTHVSGPQGATHDRQRRPVRKARQLQTASQINQWLSSPELSRRSKAVSSAHHTCPRGIRFAMPSGIKKSFTPARGDYRRHVPSHLSHMLKVAWGCRPMRPAWLHSARAPPCFDVKVPFARSTRYDTSR